MAYAKFGKNSRWYIYWADTDATAPKDEQIEVLVAERSAQPIRLSYGQAKRLAEGGDLSNFGDLQGTDERTLRNAFVEFCANVEEHYRSGGVDIVRPTELVEEGSHASEFLRHKSVALVRRPRASEVVIEFVDGTRLLVHASGGELEVSIE